MSKSGGKKHLVLNFADNPCIIAESSETLQTLKYLGAIPIRNDKHFCYKKLWKIEDVLFISDFRYFPLLCCCDFKFEGSTINLKGKIMISKTNRFFHFYEYNKNKMRCCCLIYWKFKQIFGRDVAKIICNLVVYKNDCPKGYVAKHLNNAFVKYISDEDVLQLLGTKDISDLHYLNSDRIKMTSRILDQFFK